MLEKPVCMALVRTVCVVLKSLPVLSFAAIFFLTYPLHFLIYIFIVEKYSKLF